VEADISHIETPPKIAPHDSSVYYTVDFDVILSFGLTELKAFIAWEENVSPFGHRKLRVATKKICPRVAGR
jgi:hypothetical protein